MLTVGVVVMSVLALLRYSELDCEENKLEVRLLDKLVFYTKIENLANKNIFSPSRVLRGKICKAIVQYCLL